MAGQKGVPKELIGQKYLRLFPKELLAQIGSLLDFIWLCLCDFQTLGDNPRAPLAPNERRYHAYGKFLSDALFCQYSRFEDCYLIATCLAPYYNGCKLHTDKNNPVRNYSYQKTGTFSITIKDDCGYIWLLQMVAGWRKTLDHHLFPYLGAVNGVLNHINSYMFELEQDYNKLSKEYGGTLTAGWMSTMDRTPFFMDENSPYTSLNIGANNKTEITLDDIVLKIGISRVFSESSKIHCIHCLKDILQFDEKVELLLLG